MNSINGRLRAVSFFSQPTRIYCLLSQPARCYWSIDPHTLLARFFPQFAEHILSSSRGGFREQKPTTRSLLKGVTMALKTVQETSLRHICLYTQAVAYTTYFALGEPVRGTGTQNTKWRLDYRHYTARHGETPRVFLDMTHFCLQMGKSFNISFNFVFFS